MTTEPGIDPFEVLTATCHPDSRVVALADRRVVRTPTRPDAPHGNAVLLTGPQPTAPVVAAALDDAATRLADPATTPRVVARSPTPSALAEGTWGADVRRHDVLVLPDAIEAPGALPRRRDTRVSTPGDDDRAWHAVAVLHRHAGDDAAEASARARGHRDDLLRWWVAGRRRLVAEGRARVVLARRFGTPMATLTLVWAPGADVGVAGHGLAVLCDLVVHPAHRGLGVVGGLAARLLEVHLHDFPRAVVAAVAPAGLSPALGRRGWQVHERLVELTAGRGATPVRR